VKDGKSPMATPALESTVAARLNNSVASRSSESDRMFSPQQTPLVNDSRAESSRPPSGLSSVSHTPSSKDLVDPLLYTQTDLDAVIAQREDEWKRKCEALEAKIQEEIAMRDIIEVDHRVKLECLREENIGMKTVVEEYEKTIVQLTEATATGSMESQESLAENMRAKEQLQSELSKTEENLVDAYKRVEKLKQAIDKYKANEGILKSSLQDFQDKLQRSEDRYKQLKKAAEEKVETANIEINKVRQQKVKDQAGLEAALQKANSKINSLELDIQQKKRENEELTAICDELIKKVSGDG
jgi:chromosome segregation ATPase